MRLELSAKTRMMPDGLECDAGGGEVLAQLGGGLEVDAGDAEALGGFDVGGDVVDVDGFVGGNLASAESLTINERLGFAGADGAGIDAHGLRKIFEETVGGFEFGDVDGVGVGEQTEAIFFRESGEERIFVNGFGDERGVPDRLELLEIER